MIEENGKTNNLKFSPVFIPILYSQNNNVLVEENWYEEYGFSTKEENTKSSLWKVV
ncbi:hypothetical protein [Paenibacillus farraposensis]|uniref:hypothetical protein n=1 Tax=Paenibacillus farraposensis TaxID=2807095 RepID=UPI001E5CFD22|nr:hypothetical protein [Paenibacillus farraposensis]